MKKASGAQNRKKQEAAAEQARKEVGVQRAQVAPPPLGNPVAGVAWANDVACALLYEVLNDPLIPTEKRWRISSDLIGKIGMLHSKAHVQHKLKELEQASGIEKSEEDDGSGHDAFPTVGLPATSRFAGSQERPHPVS